MIKPGKSQVNWDFGPSYIPWGSLAPEFWLSISMLSAQLWKRISESKLTLSPSPHSIDEKAEAWLILAHTSRKPDKELGPHLGLPCPSLCSVHGFLDISLFIQTPSLWERDSK